MTPLDAKMRRLALVLAAVCAVVVLAVAVKVHRVQAPLRLDVRAGHAVSARPLGIPLVPVRLARPYERLGDTGEFALLVVVVASWAAWVRDRAGAVLAVVGPAVTLVLTEVVGKPFVARREGTAYGFPSGHTAAIAALSMVGLLVAWRRWGRRGLLAAAPPAALAPLAMAVTVVRLRPTCCPTPWPAWSSASERSSAWPG